MSLRSRISTTYYDGNVHCWTVPPLSYQTADESYSSHEYTTEQAIISSDGGPYSGRMKSCSHDKFTAAYVTGGYTWDAGGNWF